jgi:hypothetical protein
MAPCSKCDVVASIDSLFTTTASERAMKDWHLSATINTWADQRVMLSPRPLCVLCVLCG